MFLLDYFFIFFIANPFGLVLFIAGLVYAEYFVANSIAQDPGHINMVKYLSRQLHYAKGAVYNLRHARRHMEAVASSPMIQTSLKIISIPIREVRHKIKKQKLSEG